ncbi:helix-turn-helix domain-containing protein [Arthrobacter sp. zg-Y1219]|uniref:winged helix-turn-helix domain-containing protein n=1 Tax=Arthrobacter sp. zg-Y1219 TaxID=3049067 RepID=UPI0024C34692|nr:helix-turn-helix domain-containing protein [Arthrobacter sp. zg-Y1219]MDK1358799.1 helix-turn-helix domain-containing protein [Arthrobacter sp. zg-Y1219]
MIPAPNDNGDASGPDSPSTSRTGSYAARAGEEVIADPIRIRALAHPLRLELLDFLDDVEQATATECAAATGESVASCSYHLRMLARHGYIEQAGRTGREKPWKVLSRGRSHVPDRSIPGSVHALSTMAAIHVNRQLDRIQSWLRRAPQLPFEDMDVATISNSSFYATHEEIRKLRDDIWELAGRFDGRWQHPEQRPEGSVPVQLLTVLNVDPDGRPGAAGQQSAPAGGSA